MSRASQPSPDPRQGALVDSPWFWLLLFSSMALVALQVMAYKFGHRQAEIERKFQGQQWSRLEPESPTHRKQDVITFSSEEDTIRQLRPLRVIALSILLISSVALVRSRRRLRAKVPLAAGDDPTKSEPPNP